MVKDHRHLIAILRGITPEEAVAVCEALARAGISMIEVPLNSRQPIHSIRAAAKALEGRASVGAGTVLKEDDVDAVRRGGWRLHCLTQLQRGGHCPHTCPQLAIFSGCIFAN